MRLESSPERPRSRRDTAVRDVPHCRRARFAGAHVSAAPSAVRRLPATADPGTDHPGGHFHRVRLLLVLLRQLGRSTRRGSSTTPRTRLGLGADSFVVEVASNDGYLLQHASPRESVPRHRTVGECRRGRARARRAHAHRVPRRGNSPPGASGARPRRSRGRQQRLRAHPGPARLHPLAAHAARRRRLAEHRGAPRAEPGRRSASSTRSITSTSSTTQCCPRCARSRRPASRSSMSNCSRHTGDRFGCGRVPRRRRTSRVTAWPRCCDRGGSRPARRRRLPRTAAADRGCPPRAAAVPAGLPRRGQASRRLRRAGQGQHAAELLRNPQRSARIHRRSQSVQARSFHARAPGSRSTTRSRSTRIGPMSCSRCPGISRQS